MYKHFEVIRFLLSKGAIGDTRAAVSAIIINTYFLNQARAGLRPARAWFLEIAFVREVSMRVCVCVCVCGCVVCVRPRGHK